LNENSREPTHQEIADVLDKPIESVKEILDLNERMVSLDAIVGNEESGGHPLVDALADKNQIDPAEILTDEYVQEI